MSLGKLSHIINNIVNDDPCKWVSGWKGIRQGKRRTKRRIVLPIGLGHVLRRYEGQAQLDLTLLVWRRAMMVMRAVMVEWGTEVMSVMTVAGGPLRLTVLWGG